MFGNALGWCISAVIVLAVGGMLALLEKAGGISPPSGEFSARPAYFDKLSLPVPPRSIVKMDDSCDSADAYRQAIAAYENEPVKYENFLLSRSAGPVPPLAAVDKVLEAAHCGTMDLFYKSPAEVVNYKAEREPLKAIRTAGQAAINLGLRKKADPKKPDPQGAMKYFEAVFCLGAKLFEERVVYEEMEDGIALMGAAAVAMSSVVKEKDPARAQVLLDFDKQTRDYFKDRIAPVWRVISSIDQTVIESHAGDVFKLAADSHEPLWRTEALLKLGRYRFNAGRAADQRGALRVLRQVADDPNATPAARLAAAAGRDLTMEQYRLLGG
jgi:hypothetical protein